MDQVSKRYSDPCFFMDGMILSGRFSEFVDEFTKTINKEDEEERSWEFFLHKIWEGTYQDFRESVKINRQNQTMTNHDLETTVQYSLNILNNFNPE